MEETGSNKTVIIIVLIVGHSIVDGEKAVMQSGREKSVRGVRGVLDDAFCSACASSTVCH